MAKPIIQNLLFRIYPNRTQVARLESTLELAREIYNAALQERRDAWRMNRIRITYFDQTKQITELKAIREDLKEVPVCVLRDPLQRVRRAFEGFFVRIKAGQKAGHPRFKGKSRYNGFTYTDGGFGLKGGKLRLSSIGDLRIKLSRPVIGKSKTVTIRRDGSKWYACFAVETIAEDLPRTGQIIGIDAGIESFATLSDGTQIDNWKYYASTQKKLRIAQRRVARRKRGSNRRKKAVAILRSIHQTIFNRRNDFQHKLSTDLIRQYDLIAIESLNIKGMSRGILSKQIHDVSWSSFFNKLRYKAEWAGRTLKEVNPNGTSQTCVCGATVRKDLSVRWHNCAECGLSEHRDVVSAKVILSLGLSDQDLTCPVTESVS